MTLRNRPSVLTCLLVVSGLLLSTSAQATLISRLGGAAAYDDVLNITWLTNANANPDGAETWALQNAWADGLDTLGFDDWRLARMSSTSPTTTVFNCGTGTAADCANAGNELGYMFYHNMGGSFLDNLTGNQTVDGVGLTNVQSGYWSGTEFSSSFAWLFLFDSGSQLGIDKVGVLSGWAVRSGDVVGVPEPGTVLLMAGGLGLLGFSRKQGRR